LQNPNLLFDNMQIQRIVEHLDRSKCTAKVQVHSCIKEYKKYCTPKSSWFYDLKQDGHIIKLCRR
jgi:hypothetical protein